MSDLELVGFWLTVLVGGVVGCMLVHAAGLATTYVRDLLHVGAGVWVVGWPAWNGVAAPVALALAITVGIALVPAVAARVSIAARFARSVSEGDEGWTGLVLYGLSYTTLTALALGGDRFPAAAGLLSLSLGDGLGGAAGRRFGAHRYRAPWAKQKSVEGSVVVAVAAAAGVAIAAGLSGAAISPITVLGLGVLAAVVEAASPRSTDNLFVPLAVSAAAFLVSR